MDSISPGIELHTVKSEHEDEARMVTHSMKQNKTPHVKPIQSFESNDQLGKSKRKRTLHYSSSRSVRSRVVLRIVISIIHASKKYYVPTDRTSARNLDQCPEATPIYFGSCSISVILLRVPHLARQAGENDIGPCLCQEQQNADKIDAADAKYSGPVTLKLRNSGRLTWQKSTESISSPNGGWMRSNRRTRARGH